MAWLRGWSRFNPFRGLPNPREVWAWGMYDLANQSFTLLVITIFFAIYFKNTIVVKDPDHGQALFLTAYSVSSLIVVCISPIAGALADFTAQKKRWLTGLCVGCAVPTMLLGLCGPGDVWPAVVLFILGNVCFMLGENFLAAFLPEVSTRETIGRVSAIGWTMGYVGALICLPPALPMIVLTEKAGNPDLGFKLIFVFAGVWFLVNAVPTLLYLRERKRPEALPPGAHLWTIGFVRLWQTFRQVGHYRDLAVFLFFFLVYCCGMTIMIANSGMIADLYLSRPALVGFAWGLAAVAGIGSVAGGWLQYRFGLKRTISVSLVLWILTCVGAAMLPVAPPGHPPGQPVPVSGGTVALLWLVGVGLSLGLGMTGTASRALVGLFTPAHRTAEFFSFWGQGYKIAGVIGPLAYAAAITGWSNASAPAQRYAMLMTAGTFAVGLIGLAFVNVPRGQRAAEESERRYEARDSSAA